MISFFIFDRWGNQIGTLDNIISAKHIDEINGEDSLTVEVMGNSLVKGNRIVWKDKFGEWHEHIVSDFEVHHAQGYVYTSAYCENSIAELLDVYIVDKRPSATAAAMLERALVDSRWINGVAEVSGSKRTSWYHISAYEAIEDIVAVFGGELSTTITVSGSSVSERRVNILERRGRDNGHLFEYGKNLSDVQRTVEPGEIYTALYGYGKGIPLYDDDGEATGGYSRKITFGDVNNGLNYIVDEEARLRWGIPDGNGGINHSFGKVEFGDCEDPQELLELTKEALKEQSVPRVSYSGNVISLAQAGYINGEDAQTGDTVYIRDKAMDLRLSGRVLKIERDLIDESKTVITLGNLSQTLTGSIQQVESTLDWIRNQAANWSGAANAGQIWLDHLMDNLNDFMNAIGGYVYWEQGIGITVYNKPADQNPDMAIQINGAGFRIANSKTVNGDWDWRTFGTGDGFTADLINVGVLRCGENIIDLTNGTVILNDGMIVDINGNYINFATGELKFVDENDKGMRFENRKLMIDADSVLIGSQSIENWTKAQIEVVNNAITLAVDDLKEDTTARLQLIEKEIALKVTSGDVQSAITASLDKIDLRVGSTNGLLGTSASISIYNGTKKLDDVNLNLTNVRSAFKNDNTAIEISAGTIKFTSNTLLIDSSKFKLDSSGKIACTGGTIGGFTIDQSKIYSGSKSSFSSTYNGVYVGTDGIALGSNFSVSNAGALTAKSGTIANFTIATNKLYASKAGISDGTAGVYIGTDGIALGANNVFKVTRAGALTATSGTIAGFTLSGDKLKGKAINLGINTVDVRSSQNNFYIGSFCATWLKNNASIRFVGIQGSSNSNVYGIALSTGASENMGNSEARDTAIIRAVYTSKKITNANVYNSYYQDLDAGWHFFANVDLHGVQLNNATIPSTKSLSIPDSIQDNINFVAITKVNPDGTIAEYVDGCSLEFTNGILTDMVKPEED